MAPFLPCAVIVFALGHPSLAPLDALMAQLTKRFDLPGAQLAVAKDGRVIHNRAYGYSDVEKRQPVRHDSVFRIGSVSKVVTQVAVLQLADRGLLSLDEKAFDLLKDLRPPPGTVVDGRIGGITIRQLLRHEAGWDPAKSFEPMASPWSRKAAAELRAPEPTSCETIIRFMLTRPLDYDPGSRSAYSNFGYCVLGRVVEAALARNGTRHSYESYVTSEVLRRAGIRDMRIGGTRRSERGRKEVLYYLPKNREELPEAADSAYPNESKVPWAYGGYYLRALEASGGWIGSAEDIVKFAMAIDGQRGRALLSASSQAELMNLAKKSPAQGERFHTAHAGALQGCCSALLYRRKDGFALGFTANSLPVSLGPYFEELLEEFDRALDGLTLPAPR